MNPKIRISSREHPGYAEMRKAKEVGKLLDIPQLFGETQWFYETDKGMIDMVLLPNYFRDGIDFYEIMCQRGNLFDDIERYATKEEAEQRIEELLT